MRTIRNFATWPVFIPYRYRQRPLTVQLGLPLLVDHRYALVSAEVHILVVICVYARRLFCSCGNPRAVYVQIFQARNFCGFRGA